jgi:flagellar biosynthesis chaperone FliJ
LDENRRTAERAVADVALLRTELGRTVDALHTVRDNQSEQAEATRSELDALHEAGVEPGQRLARLEEARRAEESVLERTHVALGNLATVDQSAMAGLEKLNRLVVENEAGLRGEVGRMRDELESAIRTLRQISDERVARQQSEITSALGAANQALDAISRYSDASNRLRSQLEGTIHQLQVGERKHLERALDHATQELRAYDERNQVDGAGPQE